MERDAGIVQFDDACVESDAGIVQFDDAVAHFQGIFDWQSGPVTNTTLLTFKWGLRHSRR
jgi:hypothetical protein